VDLLRELLRVISTSYHTLVEDQLSPANVFTGGLHDRDTIEQVTFAGATAVLACAPNQATPNTPKQ
jgi:hypothetical protein